MKSLTKAARWILVLALAAPLLGGCPGTLKIWGVNVEIPGGPGGDDDDPVALDLAHYDGVDILNIDWDEDQAPEGVKDCIAEWRAQGPNTTLDDSDLCSSCDEIWEITLTAQDSADSCLDATDLEVRQSYVRKIGINWGSGGAFDVYRTGFNASQPMGTSQNDPLTYAGVGAMQGARYTWTGVNDSIERPNRGYSFYYSGEGGF